MYMTNNTIKKIQFGGWNKYDYKQIRCKINRMIMNEIELDEEAIYPDEEVTLGYFHIEVDEEVLLSDDEFEFLNEQDIA